MAERLTEHKTTKGITRIVIKPYVVMSDEMQPIADKLCAFEDILEKYGIDMQNLDYILEEYSKNQGRDLFICEEMDKLFNNSNDIIDNNIIKKQLILIGNMFNNKLFYLTHYGIISQELRNKLIERFNLIFNKVLQAFKITFLDEDFVKIEEAMNNSIARLNKSNKECLS